MIRNHRQPVLESLLTHAIPIAHKIVLADRNFSNVMPEPTISDRTHKPCAGTASKRHRQSKPPSNRRETPRRTPSIKSVVAHKMILQYHITPSAPLMDSHHLYGFDSFSEFLFILRGPKLRHLARVCRSGGRVVLPLLEPYTPQPPMLFTVIEQEALICIEIAGIQCTVHCNAPGIGR